MEIHLHVGPHKTGTTSIQHYLLNAVGAPEPRRGHWYPAPNSGGPGHYVLATEAAAGNFSNLHKIVEDAIRAGTNNLVLSAENFAYLDDAGIARLGEVAPSAHLLITMNSLRRRAASLWQELVKHGLRLSFEESADLLSKRPDLRPDFIRRFTTHLKPHRTTVIVSSAADAPGTLISNFKNRINLASPDADENVNLNMSLGLIEVETLRAMNRQLFLFDKARPIHEFNRLQYAARQQLTEVFASKRWQDTCPQMKIKTPPRIAEGLVKAAAELLDDLRLLEGSGVVDVVGDRDALL